MSTHSRLTWCAAFSTALALAASAGFVVLATSTAAERCDLSKIRYRTIRADATRLNLHALAFSDDMTQLHSTAKEDLTPTERACARGLSQHPRVLQNTRGRALGEPSTKSTTVANEEEELAEFEGGGGGGGAGGGGGGPR
jgi:hypothetical protein